MSKKTKTSNTGQLRRNAVFIPAYSGSKWNIFTELNDKEIARHIFKDDFKKKKSLRVFDPNVDAYFHYEYVLIPASENFRQKSFRKRIGATKAKVFVDSGGYQLATGTVNHKKLTNKVALDWSEENGDIFPILDRPTAFLGTKDCPFKSYEECFDLSVGAADYYFNNRKRKDTTILNVLQGRTNKEMEKWYDAISNYKFEGWGIGGSRHTNDQIKHILDRIGILWRNGELNRKKCKIVHLFGVADGPVSIYSEYIQRWFNKLKLDVQLTYDASTWNRTLIYGGYYTDTPNFQQLKRMNKNNNFITQQLLTFTNKSIYSDMDENATLPCDCPICVDCINVKTFLNWDKVVKNKQEQIRMERWNTIFSFHNLFLQLRLIKKIQSVLSFNSPAFTKDAFGVEVFSNLKRIDKFFGGGKLSSALPKKGVLPI